METVANFRLRADRLRTFLQAHGLKVTKAVALEAQAAQGAVRDWNTLSALAQKNDSPLKVGGTPERDPANPSFGYEHLAPYIGGKLPVKLSVGLKAEISQVQQAIAIGGWPDKSMNGHGGQPRCFQCPHCQQAQVVSDLRRIAVGEYATELRCKGCSKSIDPAIDVTVPQMLQGKATFLRFRQELSQKSKPILGYESLDNTSATASLNGPLVVSCRRVAEVFSYALDMACFEFRIDKVTREAAHLGYYIGPEEVAEDLQKLGVTPRQAKQLGWLDACCFAGDLVPSRLLPHGLVVTFLPDPNGGAPSFWGYCPNAMRGVLDECKPLAYIAGKNYSKDAIFLGHLMDTRPLVLVSGFMHAIALRQAGINAVAVPSIREMSRAAIRKIIDGRKFIVVSGYEFQSNSTWDFELEAGARGVECRIMAPLSDYDGVEGFATDRFVQDFLAKVGAEVPVKPKRSQSGS